MLFDVNDDKPRLPEDLATFSVTSATPVTNRHKIKPQYPLISVASIVSSPLLGDVEASLSPAEEAEPATAPLPSLLALIAFVSIASFNERSTDFLRSFDVFCRIRNNEGVIKMVRAGLMLLVFDNNE